ncbi:MAG: hypothetical protein H6835_13620 [Planctomycetes bacterium]|nr:hypothetical protein [Planctomycetota bacterium]
MRSAPIAFLLALAAACAAPSADQPPPQPVIVELAAGTRLRAVVDVGTATAPELGAAATWWREALRQSARLAFVDVDEGAAGEVVLLVDPAARALTALLRRNGEEQVLTAGDYLQGQQAAALCGGIDALARATRAALGDVVGKPLPVAAITSPDPKVVLAVADARELLDTGGLQSGRRTLRIARRDDGGAPFVLEPLAAVELLFGDAEQAQRICREAIGYEQRTSPDTLHRLGRTLLLARAALQPAAAPACDRELLHLADVAAAERPFDDEPLWTRALSLDLQGDFAAARPTLELLHEHWPSRADVRYHLGWACLAGGEPAVAAEHLAAAARGLPGSWVLLPRAIALYEAGRHEQLEQLFDETLDEFARDEGDVLHHEVRRMRAAHALLRGDGDAARTHLVADLRWLLAHPQQLEARPGEFAEQGEVLVRLGGAQDLTALLAAVQRRHVTSAVADACAFVAGLDEVRRVGTDQVALAQQLARGGDSAWSARLLAFQHERRGEVGDMQVELARAARLSESPMTKALLAKSLIAVGKVAEGELLRGTLRREMGTLRMRETCQHPLFGPELAFAWR